MVSDSALKNAPVTPERKASGAKITTVASDEPVATFRQLLIDGDVYAVTNPDLLQYFNGRQTGYTLDPAPDNANLRPGHAYELIAATGTRGVGRLYVWDKEWSRILVYDKADGTYDGQFVAADGTPPLTDLRGMYLIDRGQAQSPILIWARPEGLYRVELSKPVAPIGSPAPSGAASPAPSAPPTVAPTLRPTVRPSGSPAPSASPTERPRRTPRAAAPTPTP